MTTPHEDEAAPPPVPGVIGTAGMINQLRGPASHVIVDVVDPGVGGATPVRQAMTSLGVKTEKPSTPPALLLSGGIVVGATVVSAGIVNLTPAVAALVFAGVVVFWLRFTNRRARRTDESTRWASRSGQPFGAWEPGAPAGRQRLLIDQRGLAIVDLGAQRDPLAVLLWKAIDRLILVPGNERATDPGLVVHRTDGRIAGFTTGFGLHEVMPALDDVGLPTDIEQAMAGTTTARRSPSPLPAAAPAPPADPWANIAPLSVGPAATMGAPSPPPPPPAPASPPLFGREPTPEPARPWSTPASAPPPGFDAAAATPPPAPRQAFDPVPSSVPSPPSDSLPAAFPAPAATLEDALGRTAAHLPPPRRPSSALPPPPPVQPAGLAPAQTPSATEPARQPIPPAPAAPQGPPGWSASGIEHGEALEAHGTSTETSPPDESPLDPLWR